MATEKQLAANLANAQKSTGPCTPEGKAKSSMNGIRHGLLARTVVLQGESEERFNETLQDLLDEFQPATATEYLLVENMAVAHWRKRRLWDFGRNCMNEEAIHQQATQVENAPVSAEITADPQTPPICQDPAVLNSRAFRKLADESRVLDLEQRYETAFDRQITRILKDLTTRQEKRKFPSEPNLKCE